MKKYYYFKKLIAASMVIGMIGSLTIIDTVNSATNNTSKSTVYPSLKNTKVNETMMQGFDWELTSSDNLWIKYKDIASQLADSGITSLWIPPAYKGDSGIYSVGYDPYDYYDLGEFDQKGTVRTKYGTIDELKEAINKLHQNKIKVIADVVIGHMNGADGEETPTGNWDLKGKSTKTKFTFDARNNKYSSFKWNWKCFNAIGVGERDNEKAVLLPGKDWNNSFDDNYLSGLNIDYSNKDVQQQMKNWGVWYVNTLNLDGFRIDAVKYMDSDYISQWISYVKKMTKKNLQVTGEAWIENVAEQGQFLESVNNSMKVFDFPLRKWFDTTQNSLDFSVLNYQGLVNSDKSNYAVTFVDNHDTLRPSENRAGISHNKQFFYAYILTLDKGLPCVFWKDYFDMNGQINPILKARKYYAYGKGSVKAVGENYYVYQRNGNNKNNGLIMIMSTKGIKKMTLNAHPHTTYFDIMGNVKNRITTDKNGKSVFYNAAGKISIWVPDCSKNK